jgi:hypothetical protein
MLSCDLIDIHISNNFGLKRIIQSAKDDSVIVVPNSQKPSWFNHLDFNLWQEYTDTFFMSIGFVHSNKIYNLCDLFGIFPCKVSFLQLKFLKEYFNPVKKDIFHDNTSSMIYLTQDTLYQLSLFKEEYDRFFYSVYPDSFYSLLASSCDSLRLKVSLSPMNYQFRTHEIIDEKEIIFKPIDNSSTMCVSVQPLTIYPTNYSLTLKKYKGNKKIDIYEPEDIHFLDRFPILQCFMQVTPRMFLIQ